MKSTDKEIEIVNDNEFTKLTFDSYSFVRNCSGGGGGGGGGRGVSNCKFWGKNLQVHLIIIKEWPKNTPPILRNLDNFPPGAFYSTPPYNQAQKSVCVDSMFIKRCGLQS